MSKTKEELDALKEEVETVNKKLHELTPEELEQVTGGWIAAIAGDQFSVAVGTASDDTGFCSFR